MDCMEGGGCNGGWYDAVWDYMISSDGICSDSTYPGVCIFDDDDIAAIINNVSEKWPGDELELTNELVYRPQAVAIDASFLQFYNSGIFYSALCSNTAVNHAVFVVGYGTEGGTEKDYYIVKNSWGTAWGESGYIRMSRNRDNNCGIANYLAYAIEYCH